MQKTLLTFTLLINVALIIKCAPYITQIAPIGMLYGRVNELLHVDLEQYITGYNVTHELVSQSNSYYIVPKVENYGTLQLMTDQELPPMIISRFISRDNLGYLNQSELILFLTNDRYVYYEFADALDDLYEHFLVTDAPGANCFGVAYLSGRIIVDCAIDDGDIQTNQLYVYNASDLSYLTITNSSARCRTSISNRTERGLKVLRHSTGKLFVFRYQYKSACLACDTEGLVEIWRLAKNNTMILDRRISGELFSGLYEFSGIDIYLGDLFLLTTYGSLYWVFNYETNPQAIEFLELQIPLAPGEKLLSVKVFPELDHQSRQLTVAIASKDYVYMADWSEHRTPYLSSRYKLDNPAVVKEVTFSKAFIFCLVSYDNITEKITVFRRENHLDNLIFGYVDVTDSTNSYIDVELETHSLLVTSGHSIQLYYFQYPYLLFEWVRKESDGTIIIRSTSYSGNESKTVYTALPYVVVPESDNEIYFDKPYLPRTINIRHPSVVSINIDEFVTGPFVKYKVSDSLANKTTVSAKNYVPVNYNLKGFDTTGIIYHKIFPASQDSKYSDNLWLFIQNRTGYLSSFACVLDPSLNLNCKLHASIFLSKAVKKLEFITNFIFVLLEDQKLMALTFMMELASNSLHDDCADIIPFILKKSNMLICMQPQLNRFMYMLFLDFDLAEVQYIDQSHFKEQVTLLSVVFEPWFPSLLFINNNNREVLIIDAELLAEYNQISILDSIFPRVTKDFTFDELRFLIVQESLIFFSSNNMSRIQEWHIGFSAPTQGKYIKTYVRTSDVNFNFNSSNGVYSSAFLLNYYISALDQDSYSQIVVFSGKLTGNDNYVCKIRLEDFQSRSELFLSGAPLNDMKADLIVVSSETGLRLFVVYEQARLTFPSFMSNSSATQEDTYFELQVLNDLDAPQFGLTFELITFNTQFEIRKVTDHIILTDLIEIDSTTNNQAFVFPTDKYFNGTILFYNLQTQQAQDLQSVYLKTKIALHKSFWSKEYPISDIKKGDNYLIIQAEKGIIRMDAQTHINCTIMPPQLERASCKLVVIDKTRHLAISLCFFTGNELQYAHFFGIKYSSNCSYSVLVGPAKTPIIAADTMKLKDGMLFILEKQRKYDETVYARVHVWNFSSIENGEYTYGGYMDQLNFNINYLDSHSFDVMKCQYGWRIFIVDASFGIRTILYSEQGFGNVAGVNLTNTTRSRNLRVRSGIIWTGISVVQKVDEEVYDLVVTAKNYNSYYLRVSLKPNEEYVKLIRGYYQYPNFDHETKISVDIGDHQAYFAINAMYLLEGRSIILLYNISDVVNIPLNGELPPFKYVDFIDYTPFREDNSTTEAFTVMSVRGANSSAPRTWIWASAPSKANNLGNYDNGVVRASYCAYEVYDYVQIVIQNAEIHSTSLALEVGNDVGSEVIAIQINNSMMNPRARKWSRILIAILFSVTVIIIVGIKFCARAVNAYSGIPITKPLSEPVTPKQQSDNEVGRGRSETDLSGNLLIV